MVPETIHTDRLVLRPLTQEVFDHVFSALDDDALEAYFGGKEALNKHRSRYQKGLTTFNRSFYVFQIIERATGKLIGNCGFHTWYTEHSRAEIGYDITDQANWGKGYMSEAVRAIIPFGFDKMQLNRIEALVGPDNQASLAIIRKFGFVQEGILRGHYYKNGVMEDSVIFGLLRSDYEELHSL